VQGSLRFSGITIAAVCECYRYQTYHARGDVILPRVGVANGMGGQKRDCVENSSGALDLRSAAHLPKNLFLEHR
jgi:hypothetical protein